jgi:hypothetical protein
MDDPKAWALSCLDKLEEHYLLKVKLRTMDPGHWFLMKHTKASQKLAVELVTVPELMGMDAKQEKKFLEGVGKNHTTMLEQHYGNNVIVRKYKSNRVGNTKVNTMKGIENTMRSKHRLQQGIRNLLHELP